MNKKVYLVFTLSLLSLLSAGASSEELFVINSIDHPSVLWTDLDASVKEIERKGQVSTFRAFRLNPGGTEGALARFFMCAVYRAAKERGFVSYLNSAPKGDRHTVIFLRSYEEDVGELINNYSGLKFSERLDSASYEVIFSLCHQAAP